MIKGLFLSGIYLCLIALSCKQESAILSEPVEPFVRLSGLGHCEPNTERREPGSTRLTDLFNPEKGSLDRLKIETIPGKISFTHMGATLNCCMDSVSLPPGPYTIEVRNIAAPRRILCSTRVTVK